MINNRSAFIVLLSFLFLFGCSSEKEITTTEKLIPANRLIKKLEGNRRKIKTFEGSGTIHIKSEKFTGKTSFQILIKKPDSIKISIYGPFGIDIAHGLFSKNNFMFYDVLKNRVFIGENSDDVLNKMFKIDLSFEELIDAFAGAVNLTDKLRTEPSRYEVLEDIYNLTYIDKSENKKNIYRITKDDLKITEYLVSTLSNKELLSGEYSKFKNHADVEIPTALLIRNRSENQSINIDYKKIKVNESLKSLKIKLPSDVNKIKW
jgi:outer membrane lipoprotein-sorting protein